MSAGATLIEMPAERGGPTPRQRAQHRPLLHTQPRMLVVAPRIRAILRASTSWLQTLQQITLRFVQLHTFQQLAGR